MMLLPEIVNCELSPPTEADSSLPSESTATSKVKDRGDVPVLATLSWLDDVAVFADSSCMTPFKLVVSAVESGQRRLIERLTSLVSSAVPAVSSPVPAGRFQWSWTSVLIVVLVGVALVLLLSHR